MAWARADLGLILQVKLGLRRTLRLGSYLDRHGAWIRADLQVLAGLFRIGELDCWGRAVAELGRTGRLYRWACWTEDATWIGTG